MQLNVFLASITRSRKVDSILNNPSSYSSYAVGWLKTTINMRSSKFLTKGIAFQHISTRRSVFTSRKRHLSIQRVWYLCFSWISIKTASISRERSRVIHERSEERISISLEALICQSHCRGRMARPRPGSRNHNWAGCGRRNQRWC